MRVKDIRVGEKFLVKREITYCLKTGGVAITACEMIDPEKGEAVRLPNREPITITPRQLQFAAIRVNA